MSKIDNDQEKTPEVSLEQLNQTLKVGVDLLERIETLVTALHMKQIKPTADKPVLDAGLMAELEKLTNSLANIKPTEEMYKSNDSFRHQSNICLFFSKAINKLVVASTIADDEEGVRKVLHEARAARNLFDAVDAAFALK